MGRCLPIQPQGQGSPRPLLQPPRHTLSRCLQRMPAHGGAGTCSKCKPYRQIPQDAPQRLAQVRVGLRGPHRAAQPERAAGQPERLETGYMGGPRRGQVLTARPGRRLQHRAQIQLRRLSRQSQRQRLFCCGHLLARRTPSGHDAPSGTRLLPLAVWLLSRIAPAVR